MSTLLENYKLIDVLMNKKIPTWHNKRTGEVALGRRLDRFLIHEDLLRSLTLYRKWVCTGGLSDHSPIYLQKYGPSKNLQTPFKFNSGYLKDPDYIKLVSYFWKAQSPLREQRVATDFCGCLNKLRTLTMEWSKRKKMRDKQTLKDIEVQIASLTDEKGLGYLSNDTKLQLVNLETQKAKILLEEEELWRLRSRAIWLHAGDGNTNFFHNFANDRKASNTIWQLPSVRMDGPPHTLSLPSWGFLISKISSQLRLPSPSIISLIWPNISQGL